MSSSPSTSPRMTALDAYWSARSFHPFPSSREVMLPAPIPTVKPTAWMIAMREKTMLTAPEALVAPSPAPMWETK